MTEASDILDNLFRIILLSYEEDCLPDNLNIEPESFVDAASEA